MPRPPKYTDDDIAEAIDSLIAEGKEVNPSRVKQRLGGGNIERIKGVMDRRNVDPSDVEGDTPDLPPTMLAELKRHNNQSLKGIQQLAAKLWQSACDEASKGQKNESAALRNRISDLEEKLSKADRRLEQVTSEAHRESETSTNENSQLVEQCEQLKEALRNAESDLRASERTITILERTQRQDREEIRSLQKRVEELVAELATIKAKN
tara:strand:+ start:1030 stop:1656 length:627 start_codon:yes stop_codon:yes gene_type:complete